MTITRMLPGVVLAAAVAAAPAAGQYGFPAYTPPGRKAPPPPPPAVPSVVPSVLPAGGQDTAPPPRPVEPPKAGAAESLGTLTAPLGATGLPPGAYPSPWYTDGPGCAGPMGRHGQVGYELYAETGPNLPFGAGEFTDRLFAGWVVAGGGRTMFFNTEGDAAWVLDLGLSYTYNRGSAGAFSDLFIRQPPTTNQITGALTTRPDILTLSRIRGLHRTAFNFAVGREFFLWGPGNPGGEAGWNVRTGFDVGGRWGTSHIDMVPNGANDQYSRRQAVFHGLFLSSHANVEVPLGGWIWASGLKVQYGFDWSNVAPPLNADLHNVNILLTSGFRF